MSAAAMTGVDVAVESIEVAAYTVPTDAPEADGTLSWDATTIVVVHARAGGKTGLGYSYADVATAKLRASKLAESCVGWTRCPRQRLGARWCARSATSAGRASASMAIAAVDVALWDLKARLLERGAV